MRVLRPLKAGVGKHTDRGRNYLDYPVGVGHTLVMAGASLAGGEPTNPAVGIGYHDGFTRVPLLLPRVMFAVSAGFLGPLNGSFHPVHQHFGRAGKSGGEFGQGGDFALG